MLTENQTGEREMVFLEPWFLFWGLPLVLGARWLPDRAEHWALLGAGLAILTLAPSGVRGLWLVVNGVSWLWQSRKRGQRGTFLESALYVTFFPKAAGPWIGWGDFRRQLRRPRNREDLGAGSRMYIAGLGKLLVLAGPMAQGLAGITEVSAVHILAAALTAALGVDGYLDAARGLGRMLGIRLGRQGWLLVLGMVLWRLPWPGAWQFVGLTDPGSLYFLRNWWPRMALGAVCLVNRRQMPAAWYALVLVASVAAMMTGGAG